MVSREDAKTDFLNKEIAEITKGDIAPKPQSRSSSRSLAIRTQVGRVAPERHALPTWVLNADEDENLRGKHVCDTAALNSTAAEDYSNQPSLRYLRDLFVQKSVFASSCRPSFRVKLRGTRHRSAG